MKTARRQGGDLQLEFWNMDFSDLSVCHAASAPPRPNASLRSASPPRRLRPPRTPRSPPPLPPPPPLRPVCQRAVRGRARCRRVPQCRAAITGEGNGGPRVRPLRLLHALHRSVRQQVDSGRRPPQPQKPQQPRLEPRRRHPNVVLVLVRDCVRGAGGGQHRLWRLRLRRQHRPPPARHPPRRPPLPLLRLPGRPRTGEGRLVWRGGE